MDIEEHRNLSWVRVQPYGHNKMTGGKSDNEEDDTSKSGGGLFVPQHVPQYTDGREAKT